MQGSRTLLAPPPYPTPPPPGPLAPIVKAASTLRSIHDWVFCEQRYNCPRSFHLAGINHLSIYHDYLKSTSTTYDDQEVSTFLAGHESHKQHRIHCGVSTSPTPFSKNILWVGS